MVKKIIFIIILIGLGIGLFFGVRYFLSNQKQQGQAGLQVKSDPPASVFLDSRFLGRTPYEDRIEPGEYTLKLIPESTSANTASWQGKIVLSSNILTVVNRELGTSDLSSAGEVISLEKLTGKDTEISIVSIPDGASVKIDGQDQGTAPLLLRNVEPGEHEVIISSPGFITRAVKAVATAGYKLAITVQLGISEGGEGAVQGELVDGESTSETEEGEPETTPGTTTTPKPTKSAASTEDPDRPYVEILDTPTGWLNVREQPRTGNDDEIITKINPGEKYVLLDEESGWIQITLSDGTEGWISGRYAEKFE